MAAPSKLEPYRDFIAAERRKKTTYRRIAELLAAQGVDADFSTIHAFVKVRSKPPRKVISMWEPRGTLPPQVSNIAEDTPRAVEIPNGQPDLRGQLDAIRRVKEAKPAKRDSGKALPSFREDAPLDRLSDDEARRLREQL